MATVVAAPPALGGSSQWVRKYPPLLLFLVALVLAVVVLPSSLNLPQTNPSTTLEYAPVPPADEEPPPIGNVNQFGLGNSSSLDSGGATGEGSGLFTPPPEPPPSRGKTPSTKRCVLTPEGPKQTDDPLAPPCVPDFNCAENGGATYQGVTRNEFRILFYFDSGIVDVGTSNGDDSRPANRMYDLAEEAEADEHVYVRLLRGWQRYFYDRYQTYCRAPHFYVYFGSRSDDGPEAKRADAASNFDEVKPFAVVSDSLASNDAYLDAMARRGVLNFGSFIGRDASFFSQYPAKVWGYTPPLETQAEQYTSFVCKNIKPFPTSFADVQLNGRPRKYGMVWSNDPNHPELKKLRDLVIKQLGQCGIPGSSIKEATWQPCCYAENNQTLPTYANNAMASFSDPTQAGGAVTTILWPGGMESKFGDAASQRAYFPEWILLGDGQTDGFVSTQYQNPASFGGHAWVVSYQTKQIDREQEKCFLAYKDADPQTPNTDIRGRACGLYERLRQLFIGIQVAGPRLGPTSIDKGFHAIPKVASKDPGVPACYYNVGDYTCVKDAVAMWWDAGGTAPNASRAGCWRMPEGGRRYITGTWPTGNYPVDKKTANDPCNGYGGNALTFLAAPNP